MAVKKDQVQVTLLLDGKQAINQLGKLEMEYADIRRSMKGLKRDSKEYLALAKRQKEILPLIRQTRQELGLQGMTLQQLIRHTRDLERTRSNSTTKGTAEYKRLTAEIRKANTMIRKQKMEARGMTGIWSSISKEMKQFGMIAISYLGVSMITSQINNLIRKTADFSDALSSVQKTTGLTKDQVDDLNRSLGSIDTRTSRSEMLAMAKVAGKLGITARKDVEGFVRAFDKINVALGEDLGNPEDVARKLGKILEAFNVNEAYDIETALLKVGSSINHLGKSSTANEGFIVEFTRRMAGIAPLANLSVQNVMGLGATLDALGQTSETSSTALNKLFIKMTQNSEEFAQYAQDAEGAQLSTAAFARLIETDFNEAFISLLRGVKDNSEGMTALSSTLGDLELDGGRIIGVLGTLANNTSLLYKQQKISNEEFERGTSVINEFNLMNETAGAKLDKVRKRLLAAFVNSTVMKGLENMVGWLDKITKTEVSEVLREEHHELNILISAIKNVNSDNQVRANLLNELQQRYPSFLGNLNAETVSNEQLSARLKEVNEQYLAKIIIQESEEELAEIAREQIELMKSRIQLEKDLAKLRENPDKMVSSGTRGPELNQGELADRQEEHFVKGIEARQKYLEDKAIEVTAKKQALLDAFDLDFFKSNTGTTTSNSGDNTNHSLVDGIGGGSEGESGDPFKLMTSHIDSWYNEQLLRIKEQRLAKEITNEEYDAREEELLLAHLVSQRDMMESAALDTVEIEQKIADQEWSIIQRRISQRKKELDDNAKNIDEKKQNQEIEDQIHKAKIQNWVNEGAAAVENASNLQEAAGNVANVIRNEIKAQLARAIATQIAKAITGVPFPLNLVIAAGSGAAVSGIFDAAVPSFYHGGETGYGDIGYGDRHGPFTGMTHQGEFVTPAYVRTDPQVVDAEKVIKARMAGYSLGVGSTGNVNSTASLDADRFDMAVARFEAKIDVLIKYGIQAKLSRTTFEDATEDYQEKETARDRGKLSS